MFYEGSTKQNGPFGYLAISVLLLLNVAVYFFALFSGDKYASLKERPEVVLSQMTVILFAALLVVIYKGLVSRKKWAYWASLTVSALVLVALPFGGANLTGVIALVAGVFVGLNKPYYTN